jgi:elongation factor G
MKTYPTQKIRNVALVGHGGSGKTTLAEAMLFKTGALNRLGRVDDGNTTSDFDPDEVERKVSINTSLMPCEWKDHKINILDTPGYADFIGEVISAYRAVNAAVIVVDAVSGVQVQTEKAWQLAEERGLPRLFFVNRLDKEHADFAKVVRDLRETFGKSVAPTELPIGSESDFKGEADILEEKAYMYKDGEVIETDFPAELVDQAQEYKEHLMEAVAEGDDALLEKYLEGQELTHDEIAKGIKQAVANRTLAPVLCGSAYIPVGIGSLLDFIVNEVPSPTFIGPAAGRDPKSGDDVTCEPSVDAPFSALVFKTVADPYVGKISYVRVFSGTLKADSTVLNSTKGEKEKISHVYYTVGKKQEDTAEIPAGDIGAIPKLAETGGGDTLCDENQPVVFNPINFPEPLVALAIHAKAKTDDEKISGSLMKLVKEDPTLRFERDASTHEQILSGVGDLQLEIELERLKNRYHVEAETSTPKIAYKETIKGKAQAQGRYKKQTGGRGQFGDVWIRMEPLTRGGDFEFVDEIVGGAIPRNFIPAVEKGIRESMTKGVLTNYPTVDIRVTLYDGSYHPVDSSEMAFQVAGSMAFKKAVNESTPILLEPIYDLEITVPEANMGDVMGDMSSKRGKISGMEPMGHNQIIRAQAPLAEIQRYSTELRSLTGGRGSYKLEFSHYEEVPGDIAKKIIEASEKEAEE